MTRIMTAIVPHVTSSSGLRKFQADGFLFDRVYKLTSMKVMSTFNTKLRILISCIWTPDWL